MASFERTQNFGPRGVGFEFLHNIFFAKTQKIVIFDDHLDISILKFDDRNPENSRMALFVILLPKLNTQQQISLSTGTILSGMGHIQVI